MKYLTLVFLIMSACSSAQKKPDTALAFHDLDAKNSFATWMGGGSVILSDTNSPEQLFVQGEAAYYEGKSSDAFERFYKLILNYPDHALTRLSTARLYELRNEVPDYAHRILEKSDSVDYEKMTPLAKTSWHLILQSSTFRNWKYSDANAPFNFSEVGFPARWTVTPLMSPWRLRDFDTAFSPEKEHTLKERYLSPVEAIADKRNEKDSFAYWSSGISLSPRFGKSGIYYLESYASLQSESEFWLVGSFAGAAKVWIDDALVFERREKGYDSGERIRHIKLSAGSHRILVKMAYQSGYRDWFDLAFVPQTRSQAQIQLGGACIKGRALPGCLEEVKVNGNITFSSKVFFPKELESFYLQEKDIASASDFNLYLSMLLSFDDGDVATFEESWKVLRERNPSFAVGHFIESEEIDWRWDIPSQIREVESLKAIKRAFDLSPNYRFSIEIAKRIGENKTDEEQKQLLKPAYDDALKNGVSNLKTALAWPAFLGKRGWENEQIEAYEGLIEKKDNVLCSVATKLRSLKKERDEYLDSKDFGPWIRRCRTFGQMIINAKKDGSEEKITRKEQIVRRYPLSVSSKVAFARELERAGKPFQHVLDKGLKQTPASATLWSKKIQNLQDRGETEEALALLDSFEKKYGIYAWTVWKKSILKKEVPLQDLLKDGRAAALDAVKKNNEKGALSKDDRYFVIDFAARQYFEDGSHITLTHTLTRLMTKAAIDDFAEQSLPTNARLLRVQTIKSNGEVRIPERVPGKSTLSMPGLAEGDFVEIAYLEFSPAPSMGSSLSGIRFFFQMDKISTLKSEYVIIGDSGSFQLKNNPPKGEKFTYHGQDAIRFLATDNPAPRREGASIPSDEYLPWVQMYRNPYKLDDFEVSRRFRFEQIQDALKQGPVLEERYSSLLSSESRGDAFIKKAFYEVAQSIKSPNASSLSTEVSHTILLEQGNPILVLKALYDLTGVESDIFVARSALAEREPKPIGEINNYGTILLRVKTLKGVDWLSPIGLDAMYGAIDSYALGQKAVCLSCPNAVWDVVTETAAKKNMSFQSVIGKIDHQGQLNADLRFRFEGSLAAYIRSTLRTHPDKTSRERMMQNFANLIPGSTLLKYEIMNEANPDSNIVFKMKIVRPKYAQKTKGGWSLETRIFHIPMASEYASLPYRTLPLFMRSIRKGSALFDVEFPSSTITLRSKAGNFDLKSDFGDITRSVNVQGNRVKIQTSTALSVQRIPIDRYSEFQAWATRVEQSSVLVVGAQ